MSAGSHTSAPYYFVPAPSQWPLVGSFAMAFAGFGAVGTVNGSAWGPWLLLVGFAILFYMLLGWFGQVAGESEGGQYNSLVDASFRWSMSWFIFSEVMFFAAFFGALFYARSITMPWLGDLDHKQFLWPDFGAAWPNTGPAGVI
ncbi:MAG: cytochrome c oxidase subunit 3, partial [Burkholderiaceae bacterium]